MIPRWCCSAFVPLSATDAMAAWQTRSGSRFFCFLWGGISHHPESISLLDCGLWYNLYHSSGYHYYDCIFRSGTRPGTRLETGLGLGLATASHLGDATALPGCFPDFPSQTPKVSPKFDLSDVDISWNTQIYGYGSIPINTILGGYSHPF